MNDPWMDRLSDYIDGVLGDAEERAVRQHLEECSECRTAEAELRSILEVARNAGDIEPSHDLWPGILGGIAGSGVVIDRPAKLTRRFSFSMPQLAAAAVVLMALTGTAVWMIRGSEEAPVSVSGTIVQTAGAERSFTTVAARPAPQVMDEIAALETALEQNRAVLDPATVQVIERSLESIDKAIADARAALEADPANPYLERQLDNTIRKKVDILRMATRVQRAGS